MLVSVVAASNFRAPDGAGSLDWVAETTSEVWRWEAPPLAKVGASPLAWGEPAGGEGGHLLCYNRVDHARLAIPREPHPRHRPRHDQHLRRARPQSHPARGPHRQGEPRPPERGRPERQG